jgi:hypothetical protein
LSIQFKSISQGNSRINGREKAIRLANSGNVSQALCCIVLFALGQSFAVVVGTFL